MIPKSTPEKRPKTVKESESLFYWNQNRHSPSSNWECMECIFHDAPLIVFHVPFRWEQYRQKHQPELSDDLSKTKLKE